MRLRKKFIVALACMTLPVLVYSLTAAYTLHKKVLLLHEVDESSLRVLRKIASLTVSAVEESFAYIASRDPYEKKASRRKNRSVISMLQEYRQLTLQSGNPTKTRLADALIARHGQLVKAAEEFFKEFEKAGSVNQTSFRVYENNVNAFSEELSELTSIEEGTLESQRQGVVSLIKHSVALLVMAGFLSFALSIAFGYLFARVVFNPVIKLKEATAEISRGNFDVPIDERGTDEIGELARSFSKMTEELKKSQRRLIQQERLQAMGGMASGIAHDFNNTLSPILGFTEILLVRPENLDDKEKVKRSLEAVRQAALDASTVVSRLREFYRHRKDADTYEMVSLNQIIADVISLTQPRWKDQAQAQGITITIKTDLKEIPPILGNQAELRQALANLVFNAVDAMPQGGSITISTSRLKESILLEVADTGVGMTPEVLKRCLEPFFTTKEERGTGLGLAMVAGILQRHGAIMDIRSKEGEGTSMAITFPIPKEQIPVRAVKAARGKTQRVLRVLLVEDDPRIRGLVEEYLSVDGHQVETAQNGREGLKKFNPEKFELVITDRGMPEMSGDELAALIKQMAPRTPVIMLTGFGDMMQAANERPSGVELVIGKPVTLAGLREALDQALGSRFAG